MINKIKIAALFNFRFVLLYVLVLAGLNLFIFNNYNHGETAIKGLSFYSGIEKYNVVIYAKGDTESGINYDKPIDPDFKAERFYFNLSDQRIRSFRIYFEREMMNEVVKQIKLHTASDSIELSILAFNKENIRIENTDKPEYSVISGPANACLELKKELITTRELVRVELFILLGGILMALLLNFVWIRHIHPFFSIMNLETVLASLFILSLLLPLPIFNITFLVSLAFSIRHFKLKNFVINRLALLFVLYFLLFLADNFLLSNTPNKLLFETLLPIFALPFYMAVAPRFNYLKLLPVSSILIGMYFFATSAINSLVYSNLDYFSFIAFAKYLHPVYYSYFLVFSLIYLDLTNYEGFHKTITLCALIILLLLSGSKLMLCFIMLYYFIKFLKAKVFVAFVFVSLMIVSILIFNPTRERFKAIFNFNDLSILNDAPLKSNKDARLNGLTLRLILWQETLNSMSGFKDVFLGKGVGKEAYQLLEERLIKRGVERAHTKYDPHNQFIATYYKMGLIGLSILLIICVYCFYIATLKQSPLLFYSTLLFCVAMSAESVLQRVVGIYFFICILLLQIRDLTNPDYNVENSNFRHEGNSE